MAKRKKGSKEKEDRKNGKKEARLICSKEKVKKVRM
jgi:hypothetical protein